MRDDRLRQLDDEKDRWFRDRSAQASRLGQDLENAGREAWNAATQAGVDLVARTPHELRALGARVLDRQHQAPSTPGTPGTPSAPVSRNRQPISLEPATLASQPSHLTKPSGVSDGAWDAVMQADAAVRGATNVVTFGGADHFAAGMDALVSGGLDHWRQRYDANLDQERARDRYDAVKPLSSRGRNSQGFTGR